MDPEIAEALEKAKQSFTVDDCPEPEAVRQFGPGESKAAFRRIGVISLDNLVKLAGLRPGDRILDIGCGPGRVALPLTRYLSGSGSYVGIDPVAGAISWSQRNIAHPNFEFSAVDWRNRMYNKRGQVDPETYRFPFPDATFDVVALFSVFTHMTPPSVSNYMREITRLLKPGGRMLATMFVFDEATERAVRAGEAHRPFEFVTEAGRGFWTDNPKLPESAIGYNEPDVIAMLASAGLDLTGSIHRGGWRRRREGQDIVVARRAG